MKISRELMFAISAITVPTVIGVSIYSSIWWAVKPPIKVGIIHSLTGHFEPTEKPLLNALWLAIDEINREGGVLGRFLQPVIVDGMSQAKYFGKAAQTLLEDKEVAVIFGGWTSASRKEIKAVVEKSDKLFFFYAPYEGLETSNNIIYVGPAPNQLILPGIWWALNNLGKRFFLVGNDAIYSRVSHGLIKDFLDTHNGNILDEHYVSFKENNFSTIVAAIKEKHPDVIINTMMSSDNIALFKALHKINIDSTTCPVLSFHLSLGEISKDQWVYLDNHYLGVSYTHTLDTPLSYAFVKKMHQAYGMDSVVGSYEASAYSAVKLWAQAVKQANSLQTSSVRARIPFISIASPAGILSINTQPLHAWRTPYIVQVKKNGSLPIIWQTVHPLQPQPYPLYRSPSQWESIVAKFYHMWHEEWENLKIV